VNALQGWFKQHFRRPERCLFGVTLVLTLILIFAQLLMTTGSVRYYLNRVDYLEGSPYRWSEEGFLAKDSGVAPEHGVLGNVYWLELGLREGEGSLEVLRNGVVAAVLEPSGTVIVYVKPGDRIEVRGEPNRDEPAVVEVSSSYGLLYPRVGDSIVTFGDNDLIGWAIPRKHD
jgi:hypothetical protein